MKRKIILTVDTEGHVGKDPISKLILGKIGDKRYGIDYIMDMGDQYGIKVLFFVDIAEAWDYGKSSISYIVKHIKDRGHDIGVHIHPDHMADKKRLFLSEYSKEEQYKIIKKCTDLYQQILGKAPVAFRAGKYGANNDTLDILAELGYRADFSEFYGQKWCGLEPPVCGSESIKLPNGLIEIPTTSYQNKVPGIFDRHDKLDVGMPKSEFKKVLKIVDKMGTIEPLVLFAHSFSFIEWRRNPDNPTPNQKAIEKFEFMLEFLSKNNEYSFTNIDEIINKENYLTEPAFCIPKMGVISSAIYIVPRALLVYRMRKDIEIRERNK